MDLLLENIEANGQEYSASTYTQGILSLLQRKWHFPG